MELLPEPFTTDGYGAVTIAEWGGWIVQVTPMLFNDRLVLTPKAAPYVYDYGYCFDKGPAAYVAARAWDPETEAEPPGCKKVVVPGRRAGEKAGESPNGLEVLASLEAVFGPFNTQENGE